MSTYGILRVYLPLARWESLHVEILALNEGEKDLYRSHVVGMRG